MSSAAETSRVKEDADKPLPRRRGLRLVACLIENKADTLVEKKPSPNFNIAISEDMFSTSEKQEPVAGMAAVPDASLPLGAKSPGSSDTQPVLGPARIAITLLAGGILGYLIGSKRK